MMHGGKVSVLFTTKDTGKPHIFQKSGALGTGAQGLTFQVGAKDTRDMQVTACLALPLL